MNLHLRILGWLYIVMGTVAVVASVYFGYATFTHASGSFDPAVQDLLVQSGYGIGLFALLIFASIGTLLTGFALLRAHRFARSLAKFFAVIGLVDFPLGTMLGVYTLWVLSQKEVESIEKNV